MKVAIIGGSGKMGRWFASFLIQDGKQVIISGRNQEKLLEIKQHLDVEVASNVDAVRSADFILLSVPIASLDEVVAEISPHIRPEQAVIDISSIKVLPIETMHRHIKSGLVLGAHPLFGPGARDMTNQNFVLTPTNEAEEALAQKIKRYLEDKRARVTLMTPQEHDEMMTIILGLAHFIAIVSADTLLTSNKFKQMEAIGGITYKVLLTLIESVVSEDPELYASLQMNLPGVINIEKLFQRKVKEWTELVQNKDRQKFVQRMKALKNGLEKDIPDFGRAYENMYKIAEEL